MQSYSLTEWLKIIVSWSRLFILPAILVFVFFMMRNSTDLWRRVVAWAALIIAGIICLRNIYLIFSVMMLATHMTTILNTISIF